MEQINQKLNKYKPLVDEDGPIRCKEKKTRFYIDNEFLAYGYASKYRRLSLIDVYSVLAKYANYQSQICFPSIKTIMKEIGLKDKNTVLKAINKLEELNIIKVYRSKGRVSNRYKLLDATSVWVKENGMVGSTVKRYPNENKVVCL